jgi:hypothetical protein
MILFALTDNSGLLSVFLIPQVILYYYLKLCLNLLDHVTAEAADKGQCTNK